MLPCGMGQILVSQLDEATLMRLKIAARERKTSVEALARDAINKAAILSVEEKLEIIRRLRAWSKAAMTPGVMQTPGVDLIREDRDR